MTPTSLSILLLCLLLSSTLLPHLSSAACIVLDYDLSPLSTADLHYSNSNHSFIYRPCQASPSCPSHSNFCRTSLLDPSSPPSPLSYWPTSSHPSLSSQLHAVDTSASLGPDGVGVVLRLTQWGGERCPGPLAGERRVTVEWVCNPVADVPVLGVREDNDCVYDAAITTKFVCQNKKRPGSG